MKQAIEKLDETNAEALNKFQAQAEVWRQQAEKPKMPEDAYAHKVLAENAYQEKNLMKAQVEYALALEKFPLWPEGQFNAALIAGELKHLSFCCAAHERVSAAVAGCAGRAGRQG